MVLPIGAGQEREIAAHKLIDATSHARQQQIGGGIDLPSLRLGPAAHDRLSEHLLELCLDALEELGDAHAQTLVLAQQYVAHEDPRDAGVTLCKLQQDDGYLSTAQLRVLLFSQDVVDQAEHGILGKLDQGLEHLCLARKVSIQGRLGDPDHAR